MPGGLSLHFQIMFIDQRAKTMYSAGTFCALRTAWPSLRTSTIPSPEIGKKLPCFLGRKYPDLPGYDSGFLESSGDPNVSSRQYWYTGTRRSTITFLSFGRIIRIFCQCTSNEKY